LSEGSFQAIRFRHAGLESEQVVQASQRLIEFMPRVGQLVQRFNNRMLEASEARSLAEHALLLRYPSLDAAPVDPNTLLEVRRPEDDGSDLWHAMNRIQESLVHGGVADHRRDRRGSLRSVRALRGIDSKVTLNKGLWALAERIADGETLPPVPSQAFGA
jgi:hypothetical protein